MRSELMDGKRNGRCKNIQSQLDLLRGFWLGPSAHTNTLQYARIKSASFKWSVSAESLQHNYTSKSLQSKSLSAHTGGAGSTNLDIIPHRSWLIILLVGIKNGTNKDLNTAPSNLTYLLYDCSKKKNEGMKYKWRLVKLSQSFIHSVLQDCCMMGLHVGPFKLLVKVHYSHLTALYQ